jgi:hypothetical protein
MSLQITFNKKADSSTLMQMTATTSGVQTTTDPVVISQTIVGKGSFLFPGNLNGYLSIGNSTDLRFGTGDFTVEMFLYQTGGTQYPRLFSMGTYRDVTFAVSIEYNAFLLWINNIYYTMGPVNLFNDWNHVAISREGTNVRVFINGIQLGDTLINTYNFADTTHPLTIGTESFPSSNNCFSGYLTNFNWVKGTALYTANFTVPTAPLTPDPNTKILLLAATPSTLNVDSSGTGKTVTNNGNNVIFSRQTPFF